MEGKSDSGCMEQMKEMEGLFGPEPMPCSMLSGVTASADSLSMK